MDNILNNEQREDVIASWFLHKCFGTYMDNVLFYRVPFFFVSLYLCKIVP